MDRSLRARAWIEANRDVGWDLLRVFVGFSLFIKGVVYLRDLVDLLTLMDAAGLSYPALAEAIAITHVAGGLLMTWGLWTRIAAAIQIPNVLGASIFVHGREGLFTQSQTLELSLLVLFILALFTLGGAGRISIDHQFSSDDPKVVQVVRLRLVRSPR